jgi:hypothetical protein
MDGLVTINIPVAARVIGFHVMRADRGGVAAGSGSSGTMGRSSRLDRHGVIAATA